jgi:hypothetical protein
VIQQVAKPKITPLVGLMLVLCFTLGTVILSVASFYMRHTFEIYYTEYTIYLFLVLACYFVIRKSVAEYRYCLYDDEIVVNRVIGQRQRNLLVLHLWEINDIQPGLPGRRQKHGADVIVLADVFHQKTWAIHYTQKGKKGILICTPGEPFVEQIRRSIASRQGQGPRNGESIGERIIMHNGEIL